MTEEMQPLFKTRKPILHGQEEDSPSGSGRSKGHSVAVAEENLCEDTMENVIGAQETTANAANDNQVRS